MRMDESGRVLDNAVDSWPSPHPGGKRKARVIADERMIDWSAIVTKTVISQGIRYREHYAMPKPKHRRHKLTVVVACGLLPARAVGVIGFSSSCCSSKDYRNMASHSRPGAQVENSVRGGKDFGKLAIQSEEVSRGGFAFHAGDAVEEIFHADFAVASVQQLEKLLAVLLPIQQRPGSGNILALPRVLELFPADGARMILIH
eukprot:CAMPEP_0206494002 /NCGR_PEP_ID=MMETSP0324_2-20121206/47420_1 /ASSEMBLY_ACC=CAM_ASM_000836 /TAXON_ID=2866 /ORGANISM="Crypthecodinium cohnii, Strain Seligo" /LENGTH=201 /DNA_ID=CAMNT_0053977477 /DNA_START=323 /DNA_END=929 /DNA_ORIENTATION=+